MRKTYSILAALLLCLLSALQALPTQSAQSAWAASPGPGFSWSSFQRFWDKQGPPLVHIKKAEAVEGGYLVDFGYTTVLRVFVRDKIVTGVEAHFIGGGDNDAGGPQFKRLVYQAITIGTYRWPEEQIMEVREKFKFMTPEDKEYRFQMTHFKYSYVAGTGWSFGFDYVSDEQNPAGRAPLP